MRNLQLFIELEKIMIIFCFLNPKVNNNKRTTTIMILSGIKSMGGLEIGKYKISAKRNMARSKMSNTIANLKW